MGLPNPSTKYFSYSSESRLRSREIQAIDSKKNGVLVHL